MFFQAAAALLLWTLPFLCALGQAETGATITAQLSNAPNRSFLNGAVLELSGMGRSVISDDEGRYEFRGVPAGPVTLAVSFAGRMPSGF